uniref:Uncharacterized protein n=1 Tax=Knipowitschia caucasica TaxID=637954 RepID=A0AAV2K1T4_KNICA
MLYGPHYNIGVCAERPGGGLTTGGEWGWGGNPGGKGQHHTGGGGEECPYSKKGHSDLFIRLYLGATNEM